VFPPSLRENLIGAGLIAGFVLLVLALKRSRFAQAPRTKLQAPENIQI
jgi:hypothetical protein